jgi:hypothetical protein
MSRALSFAIPLSVVFTVAASAVAGDAGAPPAKPGAAAPAPGAAPPRTAPLPVLDGLDWEHLSVAQKRKVMKTKVLPEAKKMFAAYDPKAFKSVTCSTCHGDSADDGTFKMPNPKLPRLPKPTSRADFVELQKKKPDAVKFMSTVVKPTMARLLGLPEWSPQETKGFGCYRCHGKEGE